MDYIRENSLTVRPQDYQEIYQDKLGTETSLEDLYRIFNGPQMPEDYTGHSLSVGDVVVMHRSGEDHAFYVDRFGYEEIPEFLAPVQEHGKTELSVQKSQQTVESHQETQSVPAGKEESALKEESAAEKDASSGKEQSSKTEQSSGKRESVLKKLSEKQEKLKQPEKQQKTRTVKKEKGEQAL